MMMTNSFTTDNVITSAESAETGTLDEHFFRNGDDASHLTEDLSTTFGHKPIDKGAKYCMYLYFRRYEEDDRM